MTSPSPSIYVILILAECHQKSGDIEAALSALASWFKIDPNFCDTVDPGYDIYESSPWNWATHWLTFKFESKSVSTIPLLIMCPLVIIFINQKFTITIPQGQNCC